MNTMYKALCLLAWLSLMACSVSEKEALESVSSGDGAKTLRYVSQNGANPDLADGYGNTLLHLAIQTGKNDVVSALIEKNSTADLPNNGGDTPLHLAAKANNAAAMEILLRANVDPVERNTKNLGKTALHYAAMNDAREVAGILLANGVDINILCGEKASPLLWASYMGSVETVRFFIENGADTSIIDTFGIGVLGRAKLGSRKDNYDYLVEIGLK